MRQLAGCPATSKQKSTIEVKVQQYANRVMLCIEPGELSQSRIRIRSVARILLKGVTSMSNVTMCMYVYINKQAGKTRGVWGDAPPGNF